MTDPEAAAVVLVFGATSLVGSHFASTFSARLSAAGRRPPAIPVHRFDAVDLADAAEVEECVASSPETVIVNFAARTDVDGIERERPPEGATSSGSAWDVNVTAVDAMARAAARTGKYLVQISTDFVFDGTNGPYPEGASRSPLTHRLSWYGWTKSEAERAVEAAHCRAAIVRISYPYRTGFEGKLDFPHWVIDSYRRHSLPSLYSDQWMTPTWVPDVSRLLELLVRMRPTGIFHVASPTRTSPLEFGRALLEAVVGESPDVGSTSILSATTPNRAPRPVQGGLTCGRLSEVGLRTTDWPVGVRLVAEEARRTR